MNPPTVPAAHALFDTPIGACGVAWSPRGLVAVQLSEGDAARTAAKLSARAGSVACDDPPTWVREAMRRIVASLSGEPVRFDDVALDLGEVPPFHRAVYEHVARALGPGVTATYGEVARALGREGGARAVGQAMARNPVPVVIPCHRVLGGGGSLRGFSAWGGVETKARMLAREGVVPGAPGAPSPVALDDPRLDREAVCAWLAARDAKLGAVIAQVGPFSLRVEPSEPYEAVARAIVYQQLTGKAAATIFGRLCDLGGGALPRPEAMCAMEPSRLRAAGLSGAKSDALKDLARRALAGEIPSREEALALSDEALIARLTAVRGVGRWTVEMLLMFNLGRGDVLSVGDYGLRKGMQRTYGLRALPTADAMRRRGARWAPWRSVASWYLWRANELPAATDQGAGRKRS